VTQLLRAFSDHGITVAGLAWCTALLTSCTLSLPVKLADLSNVHETIVSEERPAAPRVTLQLHPDGLGWQVFVNERVHRTVVSEGDESWEYRAYDLSGRGSPQRPKQYDDLCGALLLTTPLLAPFTVEEPPYWSRWDRLIPACGDLRNAGSFVKTFHAHRRFREHQLVEVEAVTKDHLLLRWQEMTQPPVQVEIPMTANSTSHGTTVRLRWLAQLLQRKGYNLRAVRAGTVQLHLIRQSESVFQRVLPIEPEDLTASLKDDQVALASPNHWPRPLVVRIERDPDLLTQPERVYLVDRTSTILNRLAIPIVLRGPELEEWRAEQVRTHQPAFSEMPSVDPAHLSGANVLLHMEVRILSAQSRVLTIYFVSIATGEILAKLAVGGRETHWPSIVDTVMAELDFTLQHLIENHPVQRAGGRSFPASGARQP
jgi:hypothetical protein